MKLDTIIRQSNLKTFYKDGDSLIKVMTPIYPQSDVLKEALNQTIANELGIPTPRVKEVLKIDDQWAIVSDYIDGTNMTHFMREHPEQTEELLNKMVDLQLAIFDNVSYEFINQTTKIHRAICLSDVDAITRIQLHDKFNKLKVYHNVCHGDFVPSNIMIDKEGKMYVLDWSYAGQGNPIYDIATSYLQMKVHQEDDALAEQYLSIVTSKTNYTREQIFEFLPVVAIVLSTRSRKQETREKFFKYFSNNN